MKISISPLFLPKEEALMAVKNEDSEDELMVAIQLELDRIVSEEVCDTIYEKAVFTKSGIKEINNECLRRKNVIMNVIADSVGLQRLYFIIRSSIMGGIAGLLTFVIISIFRVIDFLSLILIGLIVFVISLVISRIADKPIVKLSQKIIFLLKKHNRIKEVILKRL